MKKIKLYSPIIWFILIFILISILFYKYFYNGMLNILPALTTILTGVIAYIIFIQQKNDLKRNAARSIYLEIKSAEDKLKQLKKYKNFTNFNRKIIMSNFWSKYNYLFSDDLHSDHINLINEFYDKATQIDKVLTQLDISKQIEQKSQGIHDTLARIAEYSKTEADFNKSKENFRKIIEPLPYVFLSGSMLDLVVQDLEGIHYITLTSAGDKLREIAKI